VYNFKNLNKLKMVSSREIILKINKVIILIKEVSIIFIFAFLTGIGARFKIEIGLVPITMQTIPVLLSGALLGSKKGASSQFLYLLLGLSGVPWFSKGGGFFYIFSPTFGYIIGFVICSYTVGFLFEKGFNRKYWKIFFAVIIGNLLIYIPGLLWLIKFVGIKNVLKYGFYPFIFGDLIKSILVTGILIIKGDRIR